MNLAIYIVMAILTSIFYARSFGNRHCDNTEAILISWVLGLLWFVVVPFHILFAFYEFVISL